MGQEGLEGRFMHADRIVFASGKQIQDADISFIDDFLVVSENDGGHPVFYNKRLVNDLIGVSAMSERRHGRIAFL